MRGCVKRWAAVFEFRYNKRTAREHGVELDEKKLAEALRRMAKREKAKDGPEQKGGRR